jgi:hypothetical protein
VKIKMTMTFDLVGDESEVLELAGKMRRGAMAGFGNRAIATVSCGYAQDRQPVYDREFGDDRECACGHAYYRHFDWGDDYRPGCKYCGCMEWKEPRDG